MKIKKYVAIILLLMGMARPLCGMQSPVIEKVRGFLSQKLYSDEFLKNGKQVVEQAKKDGRVFAGGLEWSNEKTKENNLTYSQIIDMFCTIGHYALRAAQVPRWKSYGIPYTLSTTNHSIVSGYQKGIQGTVQSIITDIVAQAGMSWVIKKIPVSVQQSQGLIFGLLQVAGEISMSHVIGCQIKNHWPTRPIHFVR